MVSRCHSIFHRRILHPSKYVLPRDAMLAQAYADVMCLSVRLPVCPSVCPSVRNKPVLYRSDWTNRAVFLAWELPSTYPTLRSVVRKLGYLQVYRYFSLDFVPNSELGKFRHGKSTTLSTKLADGRACALHLRHSTRSCCTHIVYYKSSTVII